MPLPGDVARVLLTNIRTMADEIEDLLNAESQSQPGLVSNQLEFVAGKIELAVAVAAHGAGMVAVQRDEPPPPAMKPVEETFSELRAALRTTEREARHKPFPLVKRGRNAAAGDPEVPHFGHTLGVGVGPRPLQS